MRNIDRIVKIIIPLCLIIGLVFIGACGPQSPEGAEVKVEVISDVTGPYSTMLAPYQYGRMDYIRYLNEEKGGVEGVKIVALPCDSKIDPSIVTAHYESSVADGVVARLTSNTPEILPVLAKMETDQIPSMGVAASYTFFENPGQHYSSTGDWGKQFISALDNYFYPEWKKKGLPDPMKVSLICWDSTLGRSGPIAMEALQKKYPGRYEVVSESFPAMSTMDYSPDVAKAKAADPDIILAFVSGAAYGMVLRDAGKVDLPKDIPILEDFMGFGPGNVKLAGPEIDRLYAYNFQALVDEDVEGAIIGREISEKYRGIPLGSDYLLGIATAQLFEYTLRTAIKNVGYENVNGAAIKEALDGMNNVDIGQGVPFSFTEHEGDREGPVYIRLTQWDEAKGGPVVVVDWFKALTFDELYG